MSADRGRGEVLTVMNSKKFIWVRATDSKGRWGRGRVNGKHELQIARAVGSERVNCDHYSLQTTQNV